MAQNTNAYSCFIHIHCTYPWKIKVKTVNSLRFFVLIYFILLNSTYTYAQLFYNYFTVNGM